jgi:aquaporin NIP
MKKMIAEAIGTFALVFAGTGAIVINDVTAGGIGHVGIAATFGLVIMTMIYGIGDVSGAHFNPAVTIGFWAARRLTGRLVPLYIIAQLCGALVASVTLRFMFPDHLTLGTTLPLGSPLRAFFLEMILTALLMIVILSVSCGAKEKGVIAGIAVGGVIGLEAMFAGPITGASMNPARSIAPALVSDNLQHLWLYIAAPIVGAVLAVPWTRVIEDQPSPGTLVNSD